MAPSISPDNPKDTLFPVPEARILVGFTTHASANLSDAVHVVSLSDDVLGVHKVFTRMPHAIVRPPGAETDDGLAYEALYPKGSINPTNAIPGGFGFYLRGPDSFASALETATDVLFSYSLLFQEGFEWAKGGKLPGIYGGYGDRAYGCTGGRKEDRCSCFDLRLMWRADGAGEIYAYMPLDDANHDQLLQVPPLSKLNADFGFSVGRGAFQFVAGQWMTVAQRVRLNAPACSDGLLQLWVDGKLVVDVSGLVFRDKNEARVKGCHFQTFFGGHSSDWASPREQRAWFTSVSGAVIT